MSPEVLRAMRQASRAYVDLEELLGKAGERIAALVGAEAAFITSGAAAALAVAAAACMAGMDPQAARRLPDSSGLRDEVLMLKAHRFGFDQAVRLAGARIVEVGLPERALAAQLEAALGDRSAAFLYLAEAQDCPGSLPLAEIVQITRRRSVPVIVDAAAELPPVGNLRRYLQQGADLVLFSGGKDLRGPQSSGLILGRKDLIAACARNSCPNFSVGRPMKVDKESICGLVRAVERYVGQDFAARERGWERVVGLFVRRLSDFAGVRVRRDFPTPPGIQPAGIPRAYVQVDPSRAGVSAAWLRDSLRAGEPRIEAELDGDCLVLNPQLLGRKEAKVIAGRIAALLRRP
jgi:L-seryl-tRNA(Ser) seleniumtransferase